MGRFGRHLSLSGLWKRYGRYAAFALLLVLLLIANEYRLKRLVEHRTAALMKTLREKELLARKEEAARERLASLERMGGDQSALRHDRA